MANEKWRVKPSPSKHWPIKADRWNPWRTLAEDYPELTVSCKYQLPEGTMGYLVGKRIWLCKSLDSVDRTDTLAHELIHYERQIFPEDPAERLAEERVVEELMARRLIPFDDLCKVVLERPMSDLTWWAWYLRVGLPTLDARLITLTPVERAALQEVRGGPMPIAPNDSMWDRTQCTVDLKEIRESVGTAARL